MPTKHKALGATPSTTFSHGGSQHKFSFLTGRRSPVILVLDRHRKKAKAVLGHTASMWQSPQEWLFGDCWYLPYEPAWHITKREGMQPVYMSPSQQCAVFASLLCDKTLKPTQGREPLFGLWITVHHQEEVGAQVRTDTERARAHQCLKSVRAPTSVVLFVWRFWSVDFAVETGLYYVALAGYHIPTVTMHTMDACYGCMVSMHGYGCLFCEGSNIF